ncbi:CotH kinase family protein [Arthrobacter sp. USHLN218]|uniref:CotH kinase family protein n=1 Tax=Arthrobacter sp. USHLN218 TaxID=3081232 RepID=UPI00301780BF
MRRFPTTILSASALALTLALSGCGVGAATDSPAAGTSAAPSSTGSGSDAAEGASAATRDSFFADGVSHRISVAWEESDYADMVAAYEADGSKEWMPADITIDGTVVSNVGVRLKGNSTLRSLSGGGGPMAGNANTSNTMDISSDVPESLPLLIDFDKYTDGQTYHGLTQLALRPGSPALNEALALALTAASGQATQRYAYTTYSVNGSPTQTRLLVENPDETYADSLFDTAGVLYKSDAESSFTYQGDDLATYEEQFKQLNAEGSEDVQPIVDFLKWLSEASDEEFDAELSDWVDIESFARYTATMNLLVNGDDMAGPGQNYYLWYDLQSKKISVVSWDLNLAMTGDAAASPDEQLTIGGGGGAMPPGQDDAAGTPPGGFDPGNDPGIAPGANESGGGMAGGGGRGGNELKERFLASEAFRPAYEAAYADLYHRMYGDGTATELLDEIASAVPSSDGLTAEELADQSATLQTFIDERTAALADEV